MILDVIVWSILAVGGVASSLLALCAVVALVECRRSRLRIADTLSDSRRVQLREWNDPEVYRTRLALKAADKILSVSGHHVPTIMDTPHLPDAIFAKGYYHGHPVQILVGRYENYGDNDSYRGTST